MNKETLEILKNKFKRRNIVFEVNSEMTTDAKSEKLANIVFDMLLNTKGIRYITYIEKKKNNEVLMKFIFNCKDDSFISNHEDKIQSLMNHSSYYRYKEYNHVVEIELASHL